MLKNKNNWVNIYQYGFIKYSGILLIKLKPWYKFQENLLQFILFKIFKFLPKMLDFLKYRQI